LVILSESACFAPPGEPADAAIEAAAVLLAAAELATDAVRAAQLRESAAAIVWYVTVRDRGGLASGKLGEAVVF
jgi:hypothetical protein